MPAFAWHGRGLVFADRSKRRVVGLPCQSLHRPYAIAAREDASRQRAIFDAQVVAKQALEYSAQVGGGLEVTLLVQVGLLEARPIGNDPAALERTADQQRHRCGSVIGPIGAVDAGGPPELGN